MSKYHSLQGIYYSNPENYEEELHKRIDNPTTRFTKLYIHPFNSRLQKREKDTFEIFYLPILKIDELKEQIFTNSKSIESEMSELPDVAKQQLFFNTLIFELQSTNDIEGIRSSRKELGDAISSVINKNKREGKRFIGLVHQYINLSKGKYNAIKEVPEFRKIWNSLVSEEEQDDQPDGQYFRTQPENIMNGDKVIHEGDPTEGKIIADLESLIHEMNGHYLPSLEKCFITHYFHEYIHPFYDGNGRTGRYIACSYLARKLDILTAVSFSSTIAENKNYYYKSFTDLSNKYNHGDATMFIVRMMTILARGQNNLLKRIHEGINLLDEAQTIINSFECSDRQKEILFLLFQEHIFGNYAPKISDQELTHQFHTTRYLLNKDMKTLEGQDLVQVVQGKPKTHILSKSLREKVPQLQ